jgi:hypothetical protein
MKDDLALAVARANARTDCYLDSKDCCSGCIERYAHIDTLEALAYLPDNADELVWKNPPTNDIIGEAFRTGYRNAIQIVHVSVRNRLDKLRDSNHDSYDARR